MRRAFIRIFSITIISSGQSEAAVMIFKITESMATEKRPFPCPTNSATINNHITERTKGTFNRE